MLEKEGEKMTFVLWFIGVVVYTLLVISVYITANMAGKMRIDQAITEDLETKGRISFSFDPVRIGKKRYVVFEIVDGADKLGS